MEKMSAEIYVKFVYESEAIFPLEYFPHLIYSGIALDICDTDTGEVLWTKYPDGKTWMAPHAVEYMRLQLAKKLLGKSE